MGTAYFDEKTAREVKAAKEKEKESIDTETIDNADTTEKPKKIGRPRKINLDA